MQVWINTDDPANAGALAAALDKDVQVNAGRELKAFVIFINPKSEPAPAITQELQKLAADRKLKEVDVAYLTGPNDPAVRAHHINTDPAVRNTVFIYKNERVASKFVNLKADSQGRAALTSAIQKLVSTGA